MTQRTSKICSRQECNTVKRACAETIHANAMVKDRAWVSIFSAESDEDMALVGSVGDVTL